MFPEKIFVFRKNCGMSGKFFWLPKWYTDRKFFWRRGGGGGRRKKILSRGPKVAEKGPRHKICLRAPCSSVTLLYLRQSYMYFFVCIFWGEINSWPISRMMSSIASFVPFPQMRCLTLGPQKLKSRYSLNGMTGKMVNQLRQTQDCVVMIVVAYLRVRMIWNGIWR